MKVSSRNVVLVVTLAGLLVGAGASLRLAAVVSATATNQRLVEYPRWVDPSARVDSGTQARAEWLAHFFRNPAIYAVGLTHCVFVELPSADGQTDRLSTACETVLDEVIRSNPSSGELWLFKARALLRTGRPMHSVADALGNSYFVTPNEGWIAGGRVVLGMALFPLLPADLQQHVKSDLENVLEYPRLSEGLISRYLGDPAFRRAAAPVLQGLPADLIERFVGLTRSTMRTPER